MHATSVQVAGIIIVVLVLEALIIHILLLDIARSEAAVEGLEERLLGLRLGLVIRVTSHFPGIRWRCIIAAVAAIRRWWSSIGRRCLVSGGVGDMCRVRRMSVTAIRWDVSA